MKRFVFVLCVGFFIMGGAVKAQEAPLLTSIVDEYQDSEFLKSLETPNETLYAALALAYQNNPTLRAARAEVLTVREQLPFAQSGLKPVINAEADVTYTDTNIEGQSFVSANGPNTSKTAALNVTQPLFKGGTTAANIRQAKHTIMAQELSLSASEQQIIYEAVIAYMNVLRDKAILDLNENNYDLVTRELEQAQNRFQVGELTRTDVSQSKARLAEAQAFVATARGDLNSAMAVYRQLVGEAPPANLAYPVINFAMPKNLADAISLAQSNNRAVLQAQFISAAAEDGIDSVRGELLPQISAIGRLNKTYDPNDFIESQRQASVGLSATVPLYQGGATLSRVREAKKRANQRYIEILAAQNLATQEVTTNWEAVIAAEGETKARQSQIDAARIAREGVHYEAEFGERTTLDALDANQELLDAQVSYVTAKRNEIVARFALAQSLGILVPQNLGFSSIDP